MATSPSSSGGKRPRSSGAPARPRAPRRAKAPPAGDTPPPKAKPKPGPKPQPKAAVKPATKPAARPAAAAPPPVASPKPSPLWRLLRRLPISLHLTLLGGLLALLALSADLVYWIVHKPTELLAPVSQVLVKPPDATWRAYATDFRRYATPRVPPDLLAALAQTESDGNPAAQTYWRWNLHAADWFGIYRPASSSVGMYQMTDPAFQEARRFCVRRHHLVPATAPGAADPCFHDPLLARLSPAGSIELTAVYLDRKIAAVLAAKPHRPPGPEALRALAAVIHLCGPGPAGRFAARGYRLAPGERCGDESPAAYVARVTTLARHFRRLAERDGDGDTAFSCPAKDAACRVP